MSVQSEINRISGNVTAALAAIAEKGVSVPSGSKSDALAALIAAIEAGGGGGTEFFVEKGTMTPAENLFVETYNSEQTFQIPISQELFPLAYAVHTDTKTQGHTKSMYGQFVDVYDSFGNPVVSCVMSYTKYYNSSYVSGDNREMTTIKNFWDKGTLFPKSYNTGQTITAGCLVKWWVIGVKGVTIDEIFSEL